MNTLEEAFINMGLDEDNGAINNNNINQDLHNPHGVQIPASIGKSIKCEIYLRKYNFRP